MLPQQNGGTSSELTRRFPWTLWLIAAVNGLSILTACAGSQNSADEQFQRQVKRAQECRQMQDKLVGGQPLTPERAEEITKIMDQAGCSARLPRGGPP